MIGAYEMADGNVDDSMNIFMYVCKHYLTRKQLTKRDMVT